MSAQAEPIHVERRAGVLHQRLEDERGDQRLDGAGLDVDLGGEPGSVSDGARRPSGAVTGAGDWRGGPGRAMSPRPFGSPPRGGR